MACLKPGVALPKDLVRDRLFSYAPMNGVLDSVNRKVLAELARNPRLPMTEP